MRSKLFNYLLMVIRQVLLPGICLTAHAYAQESRADRMIPAPLLRHISIDLKGVSLKFALSAISERGELHLNYNEDILSENGIVSIEADDITVIGALMRILKGTGIGLVIMKNGDTVLIPSGQANGRLNGIVTDNGSHEPLAGANVVLKGTDMGAAADENGRFKIPHVLPGVYTLEVSMIGYNVKRIENILVGENAEIELAIGLDEKAMSLGEVVVTPGHFSLMENNPSSMDALKEEDIRSFPQLGEDIYRAITRLPGVGGNDFSAKFTVRGGEHDEVLVLLDGMELYEPFHLKILDSFLSIVDVEAIRGIDMMTGAFPAEYGNRLSGVFNMKTTTPPPDKAKTSLAISFLNARLRSEGNFSSGNGKWLLVARRGYFDLLLKRVGQTQFKPLYYDVLGKIQCFINPKHAVSAHILTAYDDLKTNFIEEVDATASHGNAYGWMTWDAGFSDALSAQTVLSAGKLDQKAYLRKAPEEGSDLMGDIDDNREFSFYGIKQNWNYEVSGNYMLKWGIDYKYFDETYDFYFRKELFTVNEWPWTHDASSFDTTDVEGGHTGNELGVYLGNRFRPFSTLTVELGLRYDRTSWTGDENVSPRINFAYNLDNKTTLRAGWGKFYQTQELDRHNIQDGEDQYYPAELAEHRIIGLEHEFKNQINLRIEAYQKKLSSIRPRWYNFSGSSMNAFGYAHEDRIRLIPEEGESRGIEFYLKKDTGGKFSWWGSYSVASVEDKIDNEWVPRDHDQRQTIYFDLNFRPNRKWCFNVAWNYHTGWPYTEPQTIISRWFPADENDIYYDIKWVPGPLNARRFPAYHRMDLKASRYFTFSHGTITAFLELRNAYNRKNVREYNYYHAGLFNGKTVVKRSTGEDWLPLLPSFGVIWEF